MSVAAGTVIALLRSARIDLSDEKRSYGGAEQVLSGVGVPFQREVRLTVSDTIDVMAEGVGVELKLC
jgi:hypothetical protein